MGLCKNLSGAKEKTNYTNWFFLIYLIYRTISDKVLARRDSMFLGINEMRYTKFKYLLIIAVIGLIGWLIFTINGLANGLAEGNRMAVDQWKIEGVVLSKEANKNLTGSALKAGIADKVNHAKAVTPVSQTSAVIQGTDEAQLNINLLGIEKNAFITPKLTKGKLFQHKKEIIVSDGVLKKEYRVGDKVKVGADKEKWKIVGAFADSSLNLAPIAYSSMTSVQGIKSAGPNTNMVNGLLIRAADISKVKVKAANTELLPTNTFIENLPGYQAQNLTLQTMNYFLIVIASFVIGIFIYIMTLQKQAIFGVLKVQGIPTAYLARSVVAQTFVLAMIGIVIGFILTVGISLVMPDTLPFRLDYLKLLSDMGLILLVSVVGSLVSIRTIVKINPLVAIGG
ncbi:efflux ABC transporter, permease protein [Listeria grayi DSM 20601]|uniref:Putative hemin transport system permease protein HrtB n=2 Tax=Listeria grayi TaxID=1641 RepID=D7UYT2_LISGR|nr:efflux ABC transporter, permease protein [Listeria grayi DSM 20601]